MLITGADTRTRPLGRLDFFAVFPPSRRCGTRYKQALETNVICAAVDLRHFTLKRLDAHPRSTWKFRLTGKTTYYCIDAVTQFAKNDKVPRETIRVGGVFLIDAHCPLVAFIRIGTSLLDDMLGEFVFFRF